MAGIVERNGADLPPGTGYPLLGSDDDLPGLLARYPAALVTVGQIKSAEIRRGLFERLKSLGADLPGVVSPLAYVSPRARIAAGTIVMHGALVNAHATIGENCIINSQALIEHDAIVGPNCHVSTGARVNGGAHIGAGCFVGSGVVIREGVRIGANCVIGAGAVVLGDIPADTLVRGKA